MKISVAAKRRDVGMTSTEMIVAMFMLLSLVAIVFVGAEAWKKGEDRAGCILNIRNVQVAVRSFQNLTGVPVGAEMDIRRDLVGEGKWLLHEPECPGGGTYREVSQMPRAGKLAVACSLGGNEKHVPSYTSDW